MRNGRWDKLKCTDVIKLLEGQERDLVVQRLHRKCYWLNGDVHGVSITKGWSEIYYYFRNIDSDGLILWI